MDKAKERLSYLFAYYFSDAAPVMHAHVANIIVNDPVFMEAIAQHIADLKAAVADTINEGDR